MPKSKLSLVWIVMLFVVPSIALAQRGGRSRGTLPAVSSIAPTGATAGGPGFALTVSGSDFTTGSTVLWNGNSISTTYVSATQLQATIRGGLIAAAGTAQVAVNNPGRSGGTSNLVAFTINPASTTTTTTTTTTPPPAAPLAITTTSLPVGTAGTAYSQALAASGGTAPYTWSTTSGVVPPGLTLSPTGAVSGTPTTSGSYAFTAQIQDSASATSSMTYSVSIAAGATTPPLAVSTASVPGGTAGTAYSTTLAATGGTSPYTWSVAAGSTLPAGLALSASGTIAGTPTTAATYAFSLQVRDTANSTSTKSYSLAVAAPTTTTVSGACLNGTYGVCGDPYEGQSRPPNQKPLSACNTRITEGGNYLVTQNIGSDPTQGCLVTYYPSSSVNLDLGGHTVTGGISVDSNVGPNIVMNGVITCNISGWSCLTTSTGGRLHHLMVSNASQTQLANINITGIISSAATSPLIRVDHITATVGYAPNVARTRNIRNSGGNPGGPFSLPLEADHNYLTCSDNASACQGVELWGAPYSYIHDNYFVLPTDCSQCTEGGRAAIFDGSGPGEFAFNTVVTKANRAVRVREFPSAATINIHNNTFLDIRTPGRVAAVHVGENDNNLSTVTVNIFNNSFELGPGGNGVVSSAATNVNVYNNTVTCLNGDCSSVGYFALTDIPGMVYPATGTSITVANNALPAGVAKAVKICGPPGSTYPCAYCVAGATTSGRVCNSGTAVGSGSIITASPPCP